MDRWHGIWKQCHSSVKNAFPESEGWRHIYWTDDRNRELVSEFYPQYLKMYDQYGHWCQRADIVRCLYLHLFGGIYLDLDYEVFVNFHDIVNTPRPSVVESPWGCFEGCHEWVQNALMCSPPNHPFWLECLEYAKSRKTSSDVIWSTGPALIGDVIKSVGKGVVDILPSAEFNPHPNGTEVTEEGYQQATFGCTWGSYARHYCSGVWWRHQLRVAPEVSPEVPWETWQRPEDNGGI
jgi:mannosyltransferase OCH1-like enzyme